MLTIHRADWSSAETFVYRWALDFFGLSAPVSSSVTARTWRRRPGGARSEDSMLTMLVDWDGWLRNLMALIHTIHVFSLVTPTKRIISLMLLLLGLHNQATNINGTSLSTNSL